MIDIGFVIVVLAMILPFGLFAFALRVTKERDRQEQLQALMKRVGFEVSQKKNLSALLNNQNKKSLLSGFANQLKRAGLQGNRILVQLAVAQGGLTFFSAYMLTTQWQSMDSKMLLLSVVLPFLPLVFVLVKKKQRQDRLRQQFPEMLDAIVRALHSGFGIDGALNMVAEEFAAPLGQEVKEVNRQLTLGVSMRDILRDFEARVEIPEAQFFVVTLIIQRETGGQLAAILEELSRLMRRRELFQAKLRTMTAESRFTALFLGASPLIYLGYKYFFDPESMAFFLNDPTGQKMLLVSLVLIGSGAVILRSMLRMKF